MRKSSNDPLFSSFYVSNPDDNGNKGGTIMTSSSSQQQASSSQSTPITKQALLYMLLLALQFGIQPTLTKRYISSSCNTSACRSSVVLIQEGIKFVIATSMLLLSGQWESATKQWNVKTWVAVAGIPSALYCVQNLSALLAYQNLDPLTFNVLNQTKTLSAAFCCYLVMGRKQSKIQLLSLVLLLVAALVLEGIITLDVMFRPFSSSLFGEGGASEKKFNWDGFTSARHFTHGVAPVLLASLLSGLAGALSQNNLQKSSSGSGKEGRNSFLFSMELCSASVLILTASLLFSEDGKAMKQNGFFDRWTPGTVIPIIVNSGGGIIVGLVTKHAGSVRKGFALVLGIFLSAVIQAIATNDETIGMAGVTKEKIVGGVIAAVSLLLHCTNPYVPPPTKKMITPAEAIAAAAASGETNGNSKSNGSSSSGPPKRPGRKMRKED